MEKKELIKEIMEIFKIVLDVEEISINENTTSDDIEEWDSLTHIQLIVAIEKHFKIKFTSMEIGSWKNVGEMMVSINSKMNK